MEPSDAFVFGFNGFKQIIQRTDMRILMMPMKLDISLLKREMRTGTCSDEGDRGRKCHARRNSPTAFRVETDDNCGARVTQKRQNESSNLSVSDEHIDQYSLIVKWNATLFSSSGFLMGCMNGEMGEFIDLSDDLANIVSSSPRKLCLHEDKLYFISDSGECFVREFTDSTATEVNKVLLESTCGSTAILQNGGRQVAVLEQGNKIDDEICDSQREGIQICMDDGCLREVDDVLPSCKAKELSTVGFTNLSAGDSHVLATFGREKRPGKIKRHEDGAYVFSPFSQPIAVQEIACGKEHALLLTAQGLVYSYGMGSRGQLGHGDIGREDVPKLLEAIACVPMVTVSAGGWHSTCISAIGDMYIWGWNESGQLGLPPDLESRTEEGNNHVMADQISFQMVPAILDLPGGVNVSKVSCGSRHTAAISYDKRLYTWGWGKYGQLGHGDVQSRDTPKLVDFFLQNRLDVLDVTCGDWSSAVYTCPSPKPMPR